MSATTALKRLFRIQYVSDLHLEFYDKATFPLLVKPCARFLALAGDIGQPTNKAYHSFLQYVSEHWDKVFYVAGNHEFYTHHGKTWRYHPPTTMRERAETLRQAVKPYANIHYLDAHNPSVYLEDYNVVVVGSTLWSHIPDEHLVDAVCEYSDMNFIAMDGGRHMRPEDINALHAHDKSLLETQIHAWGARGAQVCVLTHHMPSYRLISPRYATDPLNCCFASKCDALMRPHVRAWIYGHTHNASTIIRGKTICAVNARGYPNEHVPGFTPEAWLEFPTVDDSSDGRDAELLAAADELR